MSDQSDEETDTRIVVGVTMSDYIATGRGGDSSASVRAATGTRGATRTVRANQSKYTLATSVSRMPRVQCTARATSSRSYANAATRNAHGEAAAMERATWRRPAGGDRQRRDAGAKQKTRT